MMKEYLNVEFHCHSCYSPDSMSSLEDMIAAARNKGLDRLIITDHNSIQGAKIAQKMAPDLIIVGEEVQTDKGELLVAFVEEEVAEGTPYLEAIKILKQQNAFISVSHPFDPRRSGWTKKDLLELVDLVDAFEVFNAHVYHEKENTDALEFAHQVNKPGTVGSDAHMVREIGTATLKLPWFSNSDELRRVIALGEPQGKLSPFWANFSSGLTKRYKKLTHQQNS
jgi:predicted metal-dependent phosphoesterase TrpH